MIKGLDYANDYSAVKYMDTSTKLELLVTADGAPFDLSACQAIAVQIANSDGYIMARDVDLTALDDPSSGRISLAMDSEIMATLTPDDYRIEVWAIIKPVSVKTTSRTATLSIIDDQLEPHTAIFPSDQDSLGFTIKENLMSNDGETVAMVTLTDFENRFNQLTNDLEQQVKEMHGPQGEQGDSAYQVAVSAGFKGTQADWLASLKGSTGSKGDPGESAYQVAVDAGFTGAQAAWLDSLKGAKGDPGTGVSILGSVDSQTELPATGTAGDAYLVAGSLYVWAGKWTDVGSIQGPAGADGKTGSDGKPGADGKSAYDVAVAAGYSGTQSDWLKSLVGSSGKDGESAYQVAVDNGYSGTVAQWLDSLKGPAGKDAAALGYVAADDSKVVHLTDSLGGHNYLLKTQTPFTQIFTAGSGDYFVDTYRYSFSSDTSNNSELAVSDVVTWSFDWSTKATTYGNFGLYIDGQNYDVVQTVNSNREDVSPSETQTSGHASVTVRLKSAVNKDSNSYLKMYVRSQFNGTITISNLMLEKGEVEHDWVPAPEDKSDSIDTNPITFGERHDGADMDNEQTPGTYFSDEIISHGPTMGNFSLKKYVAWAVFKTPHTCTQLAFMVTGDVAVRTLYTGSGWGKWKGMPQDNGDGTITVNGNVVSLSGASDTGWQKMTSLVTPVTFDENSYYRIKDSILYLTGKANCGDKLDVTDTIWKVPTAYTIPATTPSYQINSTDSLDDYLIFSSGYGGLAMSMRDIGSVDFHLQIPL